MAHQLFFFSQVQPRSEGQIELSSSGGGIGGSGDICINHSQKRIFLRFPKFNIKIQRMEARHLSWLSKSPLTDFKLHYHFISMLKKNTLANAINEG